MLRVVFVTGQEIARPPYDHAVGGPCRVIRTDDHGHSEEATGSVVTNSPLKVDMILSDQSGQHVVRVASPSDDAALIAVNVRLQRVLLLLGLKDDQVTCGLDPRV